MDLTQKEKLAVCATGALGAGLLLAVLVESWPWAFAVVGAMVLYLGVVVMLALRRQDRIRMNSLDRIERKLDNLALRVVTESQATHRELSGLIEELGSTLSRSDASKG